MNEPHDIAVQSVFNLNQAAINGIRASGATSQLILVEGTCKQSFFAPSQDFFTDRYPYYIMLYSLDWSVDLGILR